MRITLLATALVAATLAGTAPIGTAFAQGDVIAQRRAGMKRMGEHMQAMRAVTQGQGEVRAQVARVDDMIAWSVPNRRCSRPARTVATRVRSRRSGPIAPISTDSTSR